MERYLQIERSIITTYRKKLWSPFAKAISEYQLLKPGDSVCVCISGGKDSMVMAKLFQQMHAHSEFEFDVKYLVMNPGYNERNLEVIKRNLEILNIPATIIDNDIFEVTNAMEKNACYLCAKMRRGSLYSMAKNMGCNKIALGHHYDDVIETILMNLLNAGSFQTMPPKLHSKNYEGMELIRPLYLVREQDIINWSNYNGLEFIQCACRFTDSSLSDEQGGGKQRKKTKELIQRLKAEYNDLVEQTIFASATNVNMNMILGYKKDGKKVSFNELYEEL